ncbi:MAG: hypothetical protein LBM73_00550, partial [Candidatus Nomurabacteria bacterium]|nr:hypothetical protein [Candidatus Nomurabacteria bacterium]
AWIGALNLAQTRRRVEWVEEGNMVIPTEIFRAVGGYDAAMKYHEAHDLGAKLLAKNIPVYFNPSFAVEHIQTAADDLKKPHKNSADMSQAQFIYYQKYWGMSREIFVKLTNF